MAWTEIGSLKGPQGDTGDAGPEGPAGPQGEPGKSVSIQGTVANAAALPTGLTADDAGKGWITDDDGHLHVWDGEAFTDVGQIEGPQGDTGPAGPAGRGITAASVDGAYRLNLTYSDATTYQSAALRGPAGDPGAPGTDGTDGTDGTNGVGITSANVDGSYRLNLAFTDSTTYQSGSIRGPQGATGDTGSTGSTGPRGASISAGAGTPGTISGELLNDLYIDTATGKIYKKTS